LVNGRKDALAARQAAGSWANGTISAVAVLDAAAAAGDFLAAVEVLRPLLPAGAAARAQATDNTILTAIAAMGVDRVA
jgi:hypothetical protein